MSKELGPVGASECRVKAGSGVRGHGRESSSEGVSKKKTEEKNLRQVDVRGIELL
jgi:hypothetical protein